eukprot:scaffold49376_cov32-Tisochrysis_lutea.AAC.4
MCVLRARIDSGDAGEKRVAKGPPPRAQQGCDKAARGPRVSAPTCKVCTTAPFARDHTRTTMPWEPATAHVCSTVASEQLTAVGANGAPTVAAGKADFSVGL